MPQLICTSGTFVGETVPVDADGVLVGRRPDADLILKDGLVSGHHARISLDTEGWIVSDLDSANGTLVNDTPIQTAVLADGDTISIGEEKFIFNREISDEPLPPGAANAEASTEDVALVETMRERADVIRKEVSKVIIGQREVLDQVLMCLIAGGHGLLIGLPGMAKTLIVSTMARVLDLRFKRIQFTPDLMPTDITGTDILETNKQTGDKEFRFVKGPIFCNLLLADEINRTPPKTQAALLEAMQEKRVTAGSETYSLEAPFFVLATQNPIEQEGTYPLPEAQLDRFMFNIWVDYPEEHEEEQIVGTTTTGRQEEPRRVLTQEQVLQLQDVVRKVPVSEHVIKYAIQLVRSTRPSNEKTPEITKNFVSTGAGPRAGQCLVLAAKARAVLEGRIHVSCADIRAAAIPVLRHRLLTNFSADSEGMTSMDIITKLLDEIPEPGPETYLDS